jgi:hypothetical protein
MSGIIFREGFESSQFWTHDAKVFPVGGNAYETEVGNIFSPKDWLFWFLHKAGAWGQPEAHNTWRHVDARRIHDGDGAYMFFGFWRNVDCGLMRQVQVAPGQGLQLTAWMHAWSNGLVAADGGHLDDGRWSDGSLVGYDVVSLTPDDIPPVDPNNSRPQSDANGNARVAIGIDPTGGTNPYADRVVWSEARFIYNGYAEQLAVEATAQAGTVTVFLRGTTLYPFKHLDFYIDDVELRATGAPARGQPRAQYERTYVLLPPSAGADWAEAAIAGTWDARRYTIGGSADDAGIGDLDARKVIAVNPGGWDGDLAAFYGEHYPGVAYEPLVAGSPDELRRRLEGETPPPPPPPPPPPDVPVFISFQQQRAAEHRDEFISRVQPPAWLLIGGFEEARHLKSLAPNMEIAIRHVDNAWGQYVHASDKDAAAERWLRHYGRTLFDQADYIKWMFDLNEYIATNDYETLRAVPSWIEALVKRLEREGWPARIVGLNVPVGNPQHNYLCDEQGIPRQVPLLTPAVRLLTDNDCLTAYHSYWGIRNLGGGRYYSTLDEPASTRMHYAFRALLGWDSTFRAAGVHPQYAFSEGGPIYINEAGVMVSSGAGWKYRETFNGDVDACVASYMQFQSLVQRWNATHGNRARWLTAFLHGGFNEWRYFDVAGEVSRRLADALTV